MVCACSSAALPKTFICRCRPVRCSPRANRPSTSSCRAPAPGTWSSSGESCISTPCKGRGVSPAGAAVAVVQVAQASDVFVVLRESAHRVQRGCRARQLAPSTTTAAPTAPSARPGRLLELPETRRMADSFCEIERWVPARLHTVWRAFVEQMWAWPPQDLHSSHANLYSHANPAGLHPLFLVARRRGVERAGHGPADRLEPAPGLQRLLASA